MVEAQGASRIVVAETGNRRRNISDQDVLQCIRDIAAWLQTNAEAHYTEKMADKENLSNADQVNAVLATFAAGVDPHLSLALQRFDGGMQYLDTYVGLSLEEI